MRSSRFGDTWAVWQGKKTVGAHHKQTYQKHLHLLSTTCTCTCTYNLEKKKKKKKKKNLSLSLSLSPGPWYVTATPVEGDTCSRFGQPQRPVFVWCRVVRDGDGHVAFPRRDGGDDLWGIVDRAPVAAVRLNPDLPEELERIIQKALEKDRELRYRSAADLQTDLKRLKRDSESGKTAMPVTLDEEWARAGRPRDSRRGAGATVPIARVHSGNEKADIWDWRGLACGLCDRVGAVAEGALAAAADRRGSKQITNDGLPKAFFGNGWKSDLLRRKSARAVYGRGSIQRRGRGGRGTDSSAESRSG